MLFNYLIKPLQRLCQYPLLFGAIADAMGESAAEVAEAAAAVAKAKAKASFKGVEEACPLRGPAKARYVASAVEESVNEINDKVRVMETAARLHSELHGPHHLAPGAAALLQREVRVLAEVPRSLTFHSRLPHSLDPRRWAAAAEGAAGREPSIAGLGGGGRRVGKLYLFADRLVLGILSPGVSHGVPSLSRHGGSSSAVRERFDVLGSWPLDSLTVSLVRQSDVAHSGRTGSKRSVFGGLARIPGGDMAGVSAMAGGGDGAARETKFGMGHTTVEGARIPSILIELGRAKEGIMCSCETSEEAYGRVSTFDRLRGALEARSGRAGGGSDEGAHTDGPGTTSSWDDDRVLLRVG